MSNRSLFIIIFITILVLVLGVTFYFTRANDDAVYRAQFLMGTIVEVKAYHGSEQLLDTVFARVKEIEDHMTTKEGSEVAAINNAAGREAVQVSEDTYTVIDAALRYVKLSGGTLDPTVGPLVKLWGIGTEQARLPEDREITALLPLVGYDKVELDPAKRTVKLEREGMGLDLGAVAKGYAANETRRILKENGIKSAYMSLGGNVLVIGSNPDGSPWRIGIQDPYATRGTVMAVVELRDTSVVTSGIYERYFKQDGKRYHHILDPATGYPVDNSLASVTIITRDSMRADALSTAVFGLGLDRGMQLVESLRDVEAIFVQKDKSVYVSSGLSGKVELRDEVYHLEDWR